jgi:hypothetical protein
MILAPGTTPPFAALTVPVIPPLVTPWACICTGMTVPENTPKPKMALAQSDNTVCLITLLEL